MTTSPFLTAKADILNWLAMNCRTDGKFHIQDDGVVNVEGSLRLSAEGSYRLETLAVHFGYVRGDCDFHACELLHSLVGSPHTVFGKFSCSHNEELLSLKGAPRTVGGVFDISNCRNLESLEDGPDRVGAYKMEGCTFISTLKGITPSIGTFIQLYAVARSFR